MPISLFSLPKTVIHEILSWTTTKTVIDFQLVSKACKTIGEYGQMWKTFFLKDFGKPDGIDLEKFQKEHPTLKTDPLFHQVFYKNFHTYRKEFLNSIKNCQDSYTTIPLGSEKGVAAIYEKKGQIFLFLGKKEGSIKSYTITPLKKTLQDENLFKDGLSETAHRDMITCLLVFKNFLFSCTDTEIKQWEISTKSLKATLFCEKASSLQANDKYLVGRQRYGLCIYIWKMEGLDKQFSRYRTINPQPEWAGSFYDYHLFNQFLYFSTRNIGVNCYNLDFVNEPILIPNEEVIIKTFISSEKHFYGLGYYPQNVLKYTIFQLTPPNHFHSLEMACPFQGLPMSITMTESPATSVFLGDVFGYLYFINPEEKKPIYKTHMFTPTHTNINYLKFLRLDYTPYLFMHLAQGNHFLIPLMENHSK